jgi:hypothetical protein
VPEAVAVEVEAAVAAAVVVAAVAAAARAAKVATSEAAGAKWRTPDLAGFKNLPGLCDSVSFVVQLTA